MRYKDENNFADDEAEDENEYEGFSVLNAEGEELTDSRFAVQLAAADTDDTDAPAHTVLGTEHTVTVHKPCAEILIQETGTKLDLDFLGGDTAYLVLESARVGLLDPAFVRRLVDARAEIDRELYDRGEDAAEFSLRCLLHTVAPEVTVKVKYQRIKKKEKSWNDGELPEASAIPENEQTVLIDNASVALLDEGTPLRLIIEGETAAVFHDDVRVGNLKPAFVKKLLETRKGQHVSCELYSVDYPAVQLKFYARAKKYTIKI